MSLLWRRGTDPRGVKEGGGYQLEKMPQGEGVGGGPIRFYSADEQIVEGWSRGVLISSFRIALVFTEVQILYDRTAVWSSAFQKEGWRRGYQLDSTAQMNRSSRGEGGGGPISRFRIALVCTEVQILYDRTPVWSSAFQKQISYFSI